MNRVAMNVNLVILIITLTTVEGKGDVEFWRDKVTLTCPEDGKWYKKDTTESQTEEAQINFQTTFDKDRGLEYSCEYETDVEKNTYQFYIKGKGCENCYEMTTTLVACVIIGDLLLTGGVILIVFLCAQIKSGPAVPQKPTSRSGGHVPVVPRPEYEPLRHGTRGKDIYSTARKETTE
ncbi:hypothetical protein UPYG_G00194370 [Umbra pygmaea]|uniref:CD3 gamma/delta subunit Ig-like domain-containing protein n=1 Tax=Umbra pygmaea TaxID=75934 RepID=A0ABD0WGS9_UMBPY